MVSTSVEMGHRRCDVNKNRSLGIYRPGSGPPVFGDNVLGLYVRYVESRVRVVSCTDKDIRCPFDYDDCTYGHFWGSLGISGWCFRFSFFLSVEMNA